MTHDPLSAGLRPPTNSPPKEKARPGEPGTGRSADAKNHRALHANPAPGK